MRQKQFSGKADLANLWGPKLRLHLQGFAQAHVICQDAARPISGPQAGHALKHELHTLPLVWPQPLGQHLVHAHRPAGSKESGSSSEQPLRMTMLQPLHGTSWERSNHASRRILSASVPLRSQQDSECSLPAWAASTRLPQGEGVCVCFCILRCLHGHCCLGSWCTRSLPGRWAPGMLLAAAPACVAPAGAINPAVH